MISALTIFLGKRLKTGSEVITIDRKGVNYVIPLSDGTHMEAEAVVCATPAFTTSAMVSSMDKNLSALLNQIFYPSVSVICLGYKREKIHHNLRGFGFLIPFKEGRKILGTLWDSRISQQGTGRVCPGQDHAWRGTEIGPGTGAQTKTHIARHG